LTVKAYVFYVSRHAFPYSFNAAAQKSSHNNQFSRKEHEQLNRYVSIIGWRNLPQPRYNF